MENGNTKNNSVVFHINGEKHSVVNEQNGIDARTALADYIRDVALLKGTKIMCREGGCGACIVTAKVKHPATGSEIVKSVNSCLTPVLSCDGWDISTVEFLGNKHEGYHEIQNRLVNLHGTQCGFCTPGMVMNMYSLMGAKREVKMEDVESSLDGNICRCTGYRPIIDAFKVLCKDAPLELKQKCTDIEDCGNCPLRKHNSSGFVACGRGDQVKMSTQKILEFSSGEKWITAKSVQSALTAAAGCNPGEYRFVAGNTSTGIFKNDDLLKTYIDINGIPDLKKSGIEENGFMLGGATTLTECINILKDVSTHSKGLEYTGKIATHLQRVANTSVRNNGTIAGNLMIKHTHRDFPSDIFVLLEGVGAKITLASLKSKKGKDESGLDEAKTMTLPEFLKTDMNQKLVTAIHLPQLEGFHFRTFKITRRLQNAHAYINAALLLKVDKSQSFEVKEKPRLVFGGVSPDFIHASKTEEFMEGKNLSNAKTLQNILEILQTEVTSKMEVGPLLLASSDYRVQLTKSLLYKTILEIIGDEVPLQFRSGAYDIPRHLMQNKQILDGESPEKTLYKNQSWKFVTLQMKDEDDR